MTRDAMNTPGSTSKIQTWSGLLFDITDPDPAQVDIRDIAHSLANQCRFNGHCQKFYSVAEHSVLVSRIVSAEFALEALLHDAAEAYVSDLPSPVKECLSGFSRFEENVHAVIAEKFGVPAEISSAVSDADRLAFAAEMEGLMKLVADPWHSVGGADLRCLPPERAKGLFLERFEGLTRGNSHATESSGRTEEVGFREPTSGGQLFDKYLFADYSGGGEDHAPQKTIRYWECSRAGDPGPIDGTGSWSRISLAEEVASTLASHDPSEHRIVVGFDHQYSWPVHLWKAAGLEGRCWRDAVRAIASGEDGRPALDIPRRFCREFNAWLGRELFWTPLHGRAASYGIGTNRPRLGREERFRLTERCTPLKGSTSPKPADAVGGMGEGIVGGQTICGLKQIARLLDCENLAWWPFDGLEISSDAYTGKHVCVEIYPTALRPEHVPQTDDNDAMHTCLTVRDVDESGGLTELMNLSALARDSDLRRRVLLEGWILGMDPTTGDLRG